MWVKWLPVLVVAALTTACTLSQKATRDGGGFYGGDGPPTHIPVDPFSVPDAVPKAEPLSATGNRPYTALGRSYRPMASARNFVERGNASWYGRKFQGKRTSSGEPYDMFAMTAAHPTLPLPSYVRVTNLDNERQVVVKVNDRGPFLHDRIIDLSYTAAVRLGYAASGTGRVEIRTVFADDKPAADKPAVDKPAVDKPAFADQNAGTVAASGGPGAYVQVGAFGDINNAKVLRSRLLAKGFSSVEIRTSKSRRRLHRVWVGPFETGAAAERSMPAITDVLNAPVHVVYEN